MTEELRVILVGFGVVGRSTAEVLQSRRAEFRRAHNLSLTIVAVVDSQGSVAARDGLDISQLVWNKRRTGRVGSGVRDIPALSKDAGADVLVEVTPGNPLNGEPGLSHIKSALDSSLHVVTANKMPLAHHYSELIALARSKKVQLRYGACVGGGLPVLDFGEDCAASEAVENVEGVLNATTNYILTKMESGGSTFEEALGEAKRAGYAEADPSLDIDGVDAAAKIVILANHVLGKSFSLKDVVVRDELRRVSGSELKRGIARGYKTRQVARVERNPEVRLLELPTANPLAIDGACNAVKFHCRESGARTISGPAAGGTTTSHAVVRDLLRIGESLK